MANSFRRLVPIPLARGRPDGARDRSRVDRDFGAFVPPFALHAAVPSVLAACWMMLRESLVDVTSIGAPRKSSPRRCRD
jgi:hypothetical protein